MTVKELIAALSKLPEDKEVVIADPGYRHNEYCSIAACKKGNIKNQNEDGDPEYGGSRVVVVLSNWAA